MPSGSSKSSSSNTTQTTSQDNRVAADNNAVALGNGASLSYLDQFNDQVKDAFLALIGLARDAGTVAAGFASNAIKANEDALSKVTDTQQKANDLNTLGSGTLFKDLFPIAGVVLVFIFGISFLGKGRK